MMRVFVAGATGVMGRELLPQLKAAGHQVFGLARTPEKLLLVEQWGAQSLRGDVLDAASVERAIQAARPDAIVNLATAIPRRLRLHPDDWRLNDRVRLEGTTNLLRAAQSLPLTLFVQASAGAVYEPGGDRWLNEDAPRSSQPWLRDTLRAEDLALASGLPACLLRFGVLNSAYSWHTQQSVTALRRGLLPIVGDGAAFVSLIHAEDAAQAVLCALARPQDAAAGKAFNVADDSPVRLREMLTVAAQCLHAPVPRTVPPFMAKMVVGAFSVEMLTASCRLSNARLKEILGFVPRYPTYREAWNQIAQAIGTRDFAPSDDLKA